jgi:hypothetical protein
MSALPLTRRRRAMSVAVSVVVSTSTACAPAGQSDTVQQLGLSAAELDVSPPVVPDARALHDALQAHCVGDDVPATPPPLPPAVQPVGALPLRCDVAARVAAVVERCGPLEPSSVAVGDLGERLGGCRAGRTCGISLPEGTYRGGQTLGCVLLQGEGGVDATVIRGTLSFVDASVVERVAIFDDYGAVSTTADLLLSDVVLVGGYEGLGLSWDQELDVALCRSRVSAGYVGVNQSWASRRVTVAGNGIAACTEATSANWGSSLQHVTQNLLLSDVIGANLHQSPAVAVIGNVIAATVAAVDIQGGAQDGGDPYSPRVRDIVVRGNDVVRGAMPTSDEARNIVVE